jgi:hypothetical protein
MRLRQRAGMGGGLRLLALTLRKIKALWWCKPAALPTWPAAQKIGQVHHDSKPG